MKTQLSDAELWQCLDEADQRKKDSSLSIDARIRSWQTYAVCLREADNRGYTYDELRAVATKVAA